MKRRFQRLILWLRRRAHLPLFITGAVIVAILFLNDETSMSRNIAYDREISSLREQIRICTDSAQYYRTRRENILNGTADLEQVAREQYHMQRPTEDVYIVR